MELVVREMGDGLIDVRMDGCADFFDVRIF